MLRTDGLTKCVSWVGSGFGLGSFQIFLDTGRAKPLPAYTSTASLGRREGGNLLRHSEEYNCTLAGEGREDGDYKKLLPSLLCPFTNHHTSLQWSNPKNSIAEFLHNDGKGIGRKRGRSSSLCNMYDRQSFACPPTPIYTSAQARVASGAPPTATDFTGFLFNGSSFFPSFASSSIREAPSTPTFSIRRELHNHRLLKRGFH